MTIAAQLHTLLLKGISGNQSRLVEVLKAKGIRTTQSSVSRALKKINAVKGVDEDGSVTYYLPRAGAEAIQPAIFESLVYRVENNGQMIIAHTRPGTANTVAKFIDDHNLAEILGSVAGDDTIIIVPANPAKTLQTQKILEAYLTRIGIY